MALLSQIVRWEAYAFVFGLAAIVAVQLLTGRINTSYLLYGTVHTRSGEVRRYFSPERVQMLVATLGAAMYFLMQLMEHGTSKFPEVPQSLLAVMGGSHAIYLGGKAVSRWIPRNN